LSLRRRILHIGGGLGEETRGAKGKQNVRTLEAASPRGSQKGEKVGGNFQKSKKYPMSGEGEIPSGDLEPVKGVRTRGA